VEVTLFSVLIYGYERRDNREKSDVYFLIISLITIGCSSFFKSLKYRTEIIFQGQKRYDEAPFRYISKFWIRSIWFIDNRKALRLLWFIEHK
jgi:hypothetical protein